MVRREAEPEQKSPLDSLPIKLVLIETTTPKLLLKEIKKLQGILEGDPTATKLPTPLFSPLKSALPQDLINGFSEGKIFMLQLQDPGGKIESSLAKIADELYNLGIEAFKLGDQITVLNRNYVPDVPAQTLELLTTALLEAKSQIPNSMETAKKLYDYVLLFVELYGKGDYHLKLSNQDPLLQEIANKFLHSASITTDLLKAIIEERPYKSQEKTFAKVASEAEEAEFSYSTTRLEDLGKE
ncbi:hypothetical protein HZC08_02255, partial [Candidatus Micrarchaeota archaeon]|nr:hypothetical protein [Candidatus Micrarchaeota archaeon]